MKIKNISCTQFAGVRDRNISFTDGINLIYGKNESGKSTLVNLLSRTLFQNARLDRRSDKDFYDLYFPGAKKGSSIKGDFADGKISFETENGVYQLKKEWGSDSRCTLSTPDGVIRDQGKIDEILKEILLYGEGVYSDILFSSQRNTDVSLKTILDASKKSDAKKEITDAVSQAFAETDGISVDAIEQAIAKKINEIAGKHWDAAREAPERKVGRWTNNLGEILNAYYALEDANEHLKNISDLEDKADHAIKEYDRQNDIVQKAEAEFKRFNTFASRLAFQRERKKHIARIKDERSKVEQALTSWPNMTENLERAKVLQSEKNNRSILDKYEETKKINNEIIELNSLLADKDCPSNTEISQVKSIQRTISSLENKLCGMNITAAINMMNGNQVEVTSLRTGEVIDVSNGIASITESVKIVVCGVLEMQLSPADVDVESIKTQIEEQKNTLAGIYKKYGVVSLEELETLSKTISGNRTKLENAEKQLDVHLEAASVASFEELKKKATAINGCIRSMAEIERDILALCDKTDISTFITRNETIVERYTDDYDNVNNLNAKADRLDKELKKTEESISGVEDIPAEYLGISDPNAHLEKLGKDLETNRRNRENALKEKTATATKLENYKKQLSGDPEEDAKNAQRIFEEQKSLLSHWKHIAEVFKTQKENIQSNPMEDIAERFSHYLGVISGGKVESEFPEPDKLNMKIYSDKKLLDYGKLSEGTKETVALAFRLAVLDHLFPDGGGVIVFDDPFTDMDADRTKQSCELIRECAKRHQVIFLTCKEEYADMLPGNEIRM